MPAQPNRECASHGRHAIIECLGGHGRMGPVELEALMRAAAAAGRADVLGCHMHPFDAGSGMAGVTGVALLAQSHITVHTWPESAYAAFDVFMCGDCDAERAAQVIADGADAEVAIRFVDRPACDWADAV